MQKEIVPCPHCGQNVGKRVVYFARCLAGAAYKALVKSHEDNVNVVQIGKLKLTTSEYARMNDLVRFGLLYKESYMSGGEYGVAKERLQKFFDGNYTISEYYTVDPLTQEIEMSVNRVSIYQVPNSQELIEMYGIKFSSYIPQKLF